GDDVASSVTIEVGRVHHVADERRLDRRGERTVAASERHLKVRSCTRAVATLQRARDEIGAPVAVHVGGPDAIVEVRVANDAYGGGHGVGGEGGRRRNGGRTT